MSQNPNELAGATQPTPQAALPPEAREVFPVRFEKDYLDFTGKQEVAEGPLVPKSSSAQASAEPRRSVTGLEDVSEEELENPALLNAEKDKNQPTIEPTKSGQPISNKVDSIGKIEPPVVT